MNCDEIYYFVMKIILTINLTFHYFVTLKMKNSTEI